MDHRPKWTKDFAPLETSPRQITAPSKSLTSPVTPKGDFAEFLGVFGGDSPFKALNDLEVINWIMLPFLQFCSFNIIQRLSHGVPPDHIS